MSDPFDIPDVEDDDGNQKPVSAPMPAGADIPEVEPSDIGAEPEPSGLDYLLSFANGASLGNGRMGQSIGDWFAGPRPEGAQVVGGGVVDQVPDTPGTRFAKGAGTVGISIPLMLAGGPSVSGQALAGAAGGGLSAHGEGNSELGGALVGAGLGALGGMAGKALSPLAGPALRGGIPGTGTRAGQVAETLSKYIPGQAYGALAERVAEPVISATGKYGPALAKLLGQNAAAAGGGAFGGDVSMVGKASAQDAPWSVSIGDAQINPPWEVRTGDAKINPSWDVQIGDAKVEPPWNVQTGDAQIHPQWDVDIGEARITTPADAQRWAIQAVLYRGNSGLPRAAEQGLTAAVMSGDREKVAAENFRLSQQYPAYADRVRKAMESLSNQED